MQRFEYSDNVTLGNGEYPVGALDPIAVYFPVFLDTFVQRFPVCFIALADLETNDSFIEGVFKIASLAPDRFFA